jgi:hypothetical protein
VGMAARVEARVGHGAALLRVYNDLENLRSEIRHGAGEAAQASDAPRFIGTP